MRLAKVSAWRRQSVEGLQEAGEADDAGQRRADLVAHIGQEFALGPDRGLGSGLPASELLFHGPAFGDVAQLGDDAGHHALAVEDRRRPALQPHPPAILAADAQFVARGRPQRTAPRRAGHRRRAQDDLRPVVGMDEIHQVAAERVGGLVAELAARGRYILDDAIAVVADDDVRGVLGQQPIARLAFGHGVLGGPALGDVAQMGDRTDDLPGVVADQRGVPLQPEAAPVAAQGPVLAALALGPRLAIEQLTVAFAAEVAFAGMDEIERPASDHLGLAVAQLAAGR